MMELFAIWVLLSGLDDLILDLAALYRWFLAACLGRPGCEVPTEAELAATPQSRIAIFVPLWREHRVIGSMIEHNLVALRYDHCDFFLGVYPNDEATLEVARELDARFPNVHVSMCPHDGPTSKADNLNWIFQRMLMFESARQARFEVVVTHDAEDLIHPEALRWVNYYSRRYDMVQIPVLPFPTPAGELIHGIYCDEFAEYQSKDLPARQFLGGFLPSSGVGAGITRQALDRLGAAYANCIFEPKCLTEDYENGFRLHRLGCAQLLTPVTRWNGAIVATRGYFPRTFRAAVRQKTRWVMGIALQSWELHGWRDTLSQLYWFWRDRKGLAGALIGPAANVVFLYGAAGWYAHGTGGHLSRLFLDGSRAWIAGAFAFSMALQTVHMGVRMRCSARVYGWKFASAAPVRAVLGNAINFLATASAIHRYFRARWSGQAHAWLKTEHAYPNRAALIADRRRLGEILVGSQYMPAAEVEAALQSQPAGLRIGEYLVHLGKLTESELYECLSLQQSVSFQTLDAAQISRPVTHALPAAVARKWRVLGYKVVAGQLFVASPEVPSEQMSEDLRRFSSLEIRFHLVTPANFEALQREFLPAVRST
jgi:bacteriophage N4 adsorption protein B